MLSCVLRRSLVAVVSNVDRAGDLYLLCMYYVLFGVQRVCMSIGGQCRLDRRQGDCRPVRSTEVKWRQLVIGRTGPDPVGSPTVPTAGEVRNALFWCLFA